MMKRKILIAAVGAILIITLICGVSEAFFSTEKQMENVITTGNIRIKLYENTASDNDNAHDLKSSAIVPDMTVSKSVTVENIGNNPAYIRIKLEAEANNPENEEKPALKLDKSILYNINSKDWTFMDDGYYYYNKPLAKGNTTEPLYTEVKFASDLPDELQGNNISFITKAYAVQAANNGENVFDAIGWPK